MPAFAHWPGTISPFSRSAATVSTMDVLPTALALANLPLPTDRVFDGKDMTGSSLRILRYAVSLIVVHAFLCCLRGSFEK